ncbi:MAG: ribosome-associated translation inhibitor RaiA [Candidatus Paceibacterota bacterium]|jgi:ribosomal subunit interface protein
MRINIKASGIELTPALSSYVNDKVAMLDKLLINDPAAYADVEIGKRTNHHKTGEWFFGEINLHTAGKIIRHVEEKDDLYAAIDKVKDGLAEDISTSEKKKNTLFKRGSRAIKNLFRRV